MKQKVLHIIWSTNTGGIERLVIELWKEQQKDPTLSVDVFAGQPNGTLAYEFTQTGTMHKGPFKNGMDFNPGKIKATRQLFEKYDILHFHSFHPATAYAARNSGKKIVYTEHGNFAFGRKQQLNDKVTRYLLRRFLNNTCDSITFNSAFSKQTAISRYGLSQKPLAVVYNGIRLDEREFSAEADEDIRNYCEQQFTIGCIGRLADVKRIDRLINVAALLKGTTDFRIIMIGDGVLEQSLKEQARRLQVEDHILFAGRREQVKRFYRLFDAFVLPSANEAFGLVVAEAMFAGTPALVFSDAGGPIEIVEQAEPENICASEAAMAQRLIALTDPRERNKKSAQRKAIAEQFDIAKMASSFKHIYQQL